MSTIDPVTPRTPEISTSRPGPAISRWLWLWASLGAVAAGLLAWAFGETRLVLVSPRLVAQTIMGQPFTAATTDTVNAATLATAMRMYGLFGALLGISLGIVGGLAGASRRAVWTATLAGAILGAVAGSVASAVAIP